jgi:RHS repeat-associated protein
MFRYRLLWTRLLLTFAILGLNTALASGQETPAARPDRGVRPNGTYSVSDVENISLQNGNVNLNIPLASLPPIAGGKLSFAFSAFYNSKVWDVVRTEQIGTAFDLSQEYYVVDSVQQGDRSGWRVTGQYGIEIRDAHQDFNYQIPPVGDEPDRTLLNNYNWYKVMLVMPDGSEHELRPLDYSPFSGGRSYLFGYYKESPFTNGAMRYYSYDGSYLFATITNYDTWTVYLPDGTRVTQSGGIQRIQDNNGNKIKIFTDSTGTHYQDEQTGREIRYFYDPAGNGGKGQGRLYYQAVGGTWMHIDINFDTTQVQGKLYTVNDWVSGQVNPRPCIHKALLSQTVPVVREIVFPATEPLPQQPRRFTFTYNSDTTESATTTGVRFSCSGSGSSYTRTVSKGWGSLSKMVTPTGAEVQYAYKLDSGALDANSVFSPDDIPGETITKKTIVQDGPDDVWTYVITPDLGSASQTYVNDGSVVSENFYPQMAMLGSGFGGSYYGVSGLGYRNTKPFQKVERHWSNLIFTGASLNSPGGTVVFNPVVDAEYTTLTDASGNNLKMSAKKFQYDFNGNVTQTTEYDWFDPASVSRDSNGVPTDVPLGATVLRTTNNSYYNSATTASSANVYAKRAIATGTPLIINALQQTTVGPSIAQFSYDGQAYGVAPTGGNVTTKKVWVDLDVKWITTSNTYGLYGNLATSTDGRGKVTQFFYDDATHALPNRVVVDPQNGTGTQTTTTAYDYSTGLVTDQTDVNGRISTISYTNQLLGTVDPFGRPGIILAPEIGLTPQRHRVTTTYIDSLRQVIVATDLNTEDDKLLKTRTTTDTLGRPVLTEQTEDGTNYTISVKNAYLDLGRVTLTSSPMRATAASTDSWTRVTKDSAGRSIEAATFAGATQPAWTGTAGVFTGAVTTSYDANFTTVTDQAGKLRRSMVDALGQLRRVDEPDTNGSLGLTTSPTQPTSYTYDVLGNLATVTQGSQTRTFTYDSLSRLRTAVNPESGTIGYQYDDTSNLVVKTDARGVSTHFAYDALNRVTRRWYNGSNSVTQTTHNTPALPSGVGVTDEAQFYYDSQALPQNAPNYTRGFTVGRLVAQTYGGGSTGDYYAYDVLGRATLKIQQTGSVNYQLAATYKLSGALETLTYPSGHTVTNIFDQAGRLSSVGGNLGDGTTRTYATDLLYSPSGAMLKEQFGTNTPIYNKLFYNSRGQLAEIRASISYTGPTDYDANRGAIINSYSAQCSGLCLGSSMPDNNGNLRRQDIQIPSASTRSQYYEYDSLNRLKSARELVSAVEQWKQQFSYDRWGNRTIDTGVTYGVGINNKAFSVDPANNRLLVPVGQSGTMTYDSAGNLTNDTYTGAGNRTYDGENKITSAWGGNNQAQLYNYDASGQRIRRKVDGVETWQVYGFGGELVAEYGASGSPASSQKEYGYRNGQLLITADGRTNVALSANGGVASASSAHTCCGFSVGGAINGNVRGPWGNGEGWNDATENVLPDWFQVDFAGTKTIDEIDVFSLHDNYTEQNTPTETQTFSLYGLVNFEVQYWNGSAWVTIPGGSVSGNNKVWRKFTFAPITTSKIRLWITSVPDSWSRLVELQAWATGGSSGGAANVTWTNLVGATASGNSLSKSGADGWDAGGISTQTIGSGDGYVEVTATEINKHRRFGLSNGNSNQSWDDIDFCFYLEASGTVYINEGATPRGSFGSYASGDVFRVAVEGGVVKYRKNGALLYTSTISPTYPLLVDTSLYSTGATLSNVVMSIGTSGTNVQWLVTDHLGTPRMVFDQTGDLASMNRHDYLPFGEELFAGVSGRTATQGYAGDGVRQQFTQKERDVETGLDYVLARYYSSTQGRFTGVDPYDINLEKQLTSDPSAAESVFREYISIPQQWNRYSYAVNNPFLYLDPTGESIELTGSEEERKKQLEALKSVVGQKAGAYLYENKLVDKDGNVKYFVGIYTNGPSGKGAAFEKINSAAGEVSAIITDPRNTRVKVVAAGTEITDDNKDSFRIGAIGSSPGATPGVTGSFGGVITAYILDPATKPGKLAKEYWSNNIAQEPSTGELLGHELGHARAIVTGDPDVLGASLRLENKVRKDVSRKKSTRKMH